MSSSVRPGYRLKQTPIDKWSIREKLALASSVHRSGDQNWYSVSRSLKCFGEPNRPADWFSQKNCALQYSELLENVETPKRKRGERGENTAQDLIVLELQQKRIAELKELLIKEKKECSDLKEELDYFKSGSANPDKYREIWERMKKEEKDKEIAEEEHKKWLVEREAKIAQMKVNRQMVLIRSPKSPKSAKSSQATSPAESDIKAKLEVPDKLPEQLTVKIEPPSTDTENSLSNAPQTPTSSASQSAPSQQLQQTSQTPQTPEKTKITPSPIISSPSTSPLLTHLLQSPSPSAAGAVPYNILSPSTLKEMQQKTSPSSTHFFPSNITSPTLPRIPMTPLSSSNVTPEQLPSSILEESVSSVKETVEPASTSVSDNSSPSAAMSSPTLSKLLETSPTTSVKALVSSLKEAESCELTLQDAEMTEVKESVPEIIEEPHNPLDHIDTNRLTKTESIVETVIDNESIETVKVDETQQLNVNEKSVTVDNELLSENQPTPSTVSSSIAEVIKSVAEAYDLENAVNTEVLTSSEPATDIKQEIIELSESTDETPMEVDSKIIKPEVKTDTDNSNQPATPTDSKVPVPSSSSTVSRKRKRPPPIIATPPTAPTRRSNRVRTIKDKTGSEEEQTPASVDEAGTIQSVATATTETVVVTTTPSTTITTTPTSSTPLTSTSLPMTSATPTVTVAASSTVPVVPVVSTAVTPSVTGKKTNVPTPSALPPPPPLSISVENSAGEESTDNTNISLPTTLIKPPTSAPTTAPTSKASSVTESAPNSPASAILTAEEIENQKEYKMWKKTIMLLWKQAHTHKFSTLFTHPVTDSEAKGYSTVVYRPIDLMSIRKKLESGQIKTTAEFQRDMMLMFQNAIMYNSVDHDVHQMAVEMQKEILEGIEDFIETQKSSSPSANEPTKPRGRRSNVSTSSDAHDPETAEARRRKRVSTDTAETPQPTSTPSSTSKTKTKKKPPN